MKRLILLGIALAMLSGCAGLPEPMALSPQFMEETDKGVAIVVTQLPEPDYITIGQQGLLDLAINEGANSALNEHLAKLDISEFNAVIQDFSERMKRDELEVVNAISGYTLPESLQSFRGGKKDDTVRYADQDYRFLAEETGADRVLLINVPVVGVTRAYSGFIPTGDPHGHVTAIAQIVDMETNQLLWLSRIEINLDIEEPWDEAPTFPNVTTSVYQALEQARLLMLADFKVMPAAPEPIPTESESR